MIFALPSGSPIALETPDLTAKFGDVVQSSADFRPAGDPPATLADLLHFVGYESNRRHGKSFKLLEEWQGKSSEQISLRELFVRRTMAGFRPFLTNKGYLENTIVAYRKGLTYLRNLAASRGVQVEPDYKQTWLVVMQRAKKNYCMLFAEHFEALYTSPDDVPVEEVDAHLFDLVKSGHATLTAARKARSVFLATLRECGYTKRQPVAAARDRKYAESLKDLPEPLQSEVKALKSWTTKSDDSGEWHTDWDHYEEDKEQRYIELREVTAAKVIAEVCRSYGFVKNICQKEDGVNSLEMLMREKIFRSFRDWMLYKQKLTGTGVQTRLGTLFSTLKQYPGASHINLTWVPALLQTIPATPQKEVRARKSTRLVTMQALEAIPELLRKERNNLITQHNRIQKSETSPRRRGRAASTEEKLAKGRATRLVRIAVLAQQELIIRFLLTLVWRNENLSECRIQPVGDRPANLFKGPVVLKPGKDIPAWASERMRIDPNVHLYQFEFSTEETKAGREVMAVLPKILDPYVEEFLSYYRPILVCGEDPKTLFLNQFGNPISKQQLEEAVQEATLKYLGKSVNPHLFRDIYAVEYLRDPDNHADYLTLSKILWHGSPEITIKHYAWIFNESIGTSAAGEWAEKRNRERHRTDDSVRPCATRQQSARIPVRPPAPILQVRGVTRAARREVRGG